jgi:3-hydroxybutyryl-CoA dehydrogenase
VNGQVFIVGAGLMGTGIAVQFARGGYLVRCYDPHPERLEESAIRARAVLDEMFGGGNEERRQASEVFSRITYSRSMENNATATLVIEAAPENLSLKRQLYSELEESVAADVIIASNTSGILPDTLSEGMRNPARFLIAHFWNPPHSIPLVELVPGALTLRRYIVEIQTILKAIQMEPVVLEHALPGFIGNRLQFAVIREALNLLRSGVASAEIIDKVMTASLGRRYVRMGPFAAADLGGLDTILSVAEQLMPYLAKDEDVLDLLRAKVNEGAVGRRTGRGFYVWDKGS